MRSSTEPTTAEGGQPRTGQHSGQYRVRRRRSLARELADVGAGNIVPFLRPAVARDEVAEPRSAGNDNSVADAPLAFPREPASAAAVSAALTAAQQVSEVAAKAAPAWIERAHRRRVRSAAQSLFGLAMTATVTGIFIAVAAHFLVVVPLAG